MPKTALPRPPVSGNAYMRDLIETSTLAAVIGALTGLVAVGVRVALNFVTGLAFRQDVEVLFTPPSVTDLGAWVILVPAVGALFAYGVVKLASDDTRIRGSSEIVRSVAHKRGRIQPLKIGGHAIGNILSVGTGGSAGREGIMVQLGAALGAVASLITGASIRHRKTLLAAGGAAAIASTFNTPIAGVLFAHEVILIEWTTRSFVPLTVASAMGTLVATQFLGDQPAFPIPGYELVSPQELWLYVLLGILAGLLSIAVLRSLVASDRIFAKIPGPRFVPPVVGGLLVGVIGFFVPEVLGVGYETVKGVLLEDFWVVGLFGIVVAKIAAFAITRGSGGASGAFSPSLFLGAGLGGVFGALVHQWFPTWTASAGAYALVGMAAVYAAVTRASLTAIVMLYEMTHTFSIVIPVMIAVVVADALAKAYGGGTFFALPGSRAPIETDATVNILDVVPVEDIMTKDVLTVRADAPVRTVVEKRFQTGHHGYPVLDAGGHLVGIITATDMRTKVKDGMLDRPVREFMTPGPVSVSPHTTAHEALGEMVRLDVGHLPVVDPQQPLKLVGFLTRSDVLNVERRIYDEELRQEDLYHARIEPLLRGEWKGRGDREKPFEEERGRPPP